MAGRDGKVLVWQWGRFGAGPRFAYELAWALRQFTPLQPLLSLSEQAELYQGLDDFSVVDLPVATYRGAADAVVKTFGLPRLLNALGRFVARERPIAAISVLPGYWDVFAAARLARLGVPVLTIVHDAQSHPGDWLAPAIALHRRQIAKSAGVITLTDFVAGHLRRRGQIGTRSHWTIPHPAFAFPDLGLPEASQTDFSKRRRLRLVLPGRLKSYKGVHLLIEALRLVDPGLVEARIAGAAGDGEWIAAAQSLPNCELDLRWLSETELVAEIDRSDVLVAPYVEASQSGVVALAICRGRPVIATPVGGLPEQVRDGETGLLTTSVTAEALAACIRRFAAEPALYSRCAAGALAAAKDEIGWPRVAQAYAAAVAQTAAARR